MKEYERLQIRLNTWNEHQPDVETLYGIALILNIEGMTLMQLRNLAITELGAPLNAASLKTHLEERKKLGLS